MTIRNCVPAVALAAATVLVVWTDSVRARDEGRFTVMLLNFDFVPHARPKWGDVYYVRLAPTIRFSSFAECHAATDRLNRRFQRKTKAYTRDSWRGKSYNHQVICYSESATSDQAITWDICDRAHLGFEYAKTCQALTYYKPMIDRVLREDRQLRLKRSLGQ